VNKNPGKVSISKETLIRDLENLLRFHQVVDRLVRLPEIKCHTIATL
jgi:hypothetical protein